jgi:hypothetical protein
MLTALATQNVPRSYSFRNENNLPLNTPHNHTAQGFVPSTATSRSLATKKARTARPTETTSLVNGSGLFAIDLL